MKGRGKTLRGGGTMPELAVERSAAGCASPAIVRPSRLASARHMRAGNGIPNGLLFPVVPLKRAGEVDGSETWYWSSTPNNNNAWNVNMTNGNVNNNNQNNSYWVWPCRGGESRSLRPRNLSLM